MRLGHEKELGERKGPAGPHPAAIVSLFFTFLVLRFPYFQKKEKNKFLTFTQTHNFVVKEKKKDFIEKKIKF